MSYENIKHEPMWAIRHIPTGKLLPANPKGYGHTQMHIEGNKATGLMPRLFDSERTAKYCLLKWLQGVHRNEWEDGIQLYNPKTPRIPEDMEVIEIELITGEKYVAPDDRDIR